MVLYRAYVMEFSMKCYDALRQIKGEENAFMRSESF